ncbi:MAG: hypothetical protein J0I66_01985, partial [Microbacterium sp.]|nr:hypothetical protein [Microbacterium sp.]
MEISQQQLQGLPVQGSQRVVQRRIDVDRDIGAMRHGVHHFPQRIADPDLFDPPGTAGIEPRQRQQL